MPRWCTSACGSRRCASRCEAFVASSQHDVNGTVTLALYKGNVDVAGRKSETSLYRPDIASFTMGASYDQKDAEGFIRILGLPARSRAIIHAKQQEKVCRSQEAVGVRHERVCRVEGGSAVKMWSGRFNQAPDAEFEQWQRSFPFDRVLLPYEVAASKAHASALAKAGVLTAEELAATLFALDQIAREGVPEVDDPAIEDVHHYVEHRLVEIAGEVGYKLHTGRSRNEQIATDLRLYVREQIDDMTRLLAEFCSAFIASRREASGRPAPCRRTRICSAPSRCWWRIGCWPTSRCSCATSIAWPIAASG